MLIEMDLPFPTVWQIHQRYYWWLCL